MAPRTGRPGTDRLKLNRAVPDCPRFLVFAFLEAVGGNRSHRSSLTQLMWASHVMCPKRNMVTQKIWAENGDDLSPTLDHPKSLQLQVFRSRAQNFHSLGIRLGIRFNPE